MADSTGTCDHPYTGPGGVDQKVHEVGIEHVGYGPATVKVRVRIGPVRSLEDVLDPGTDLLDGRLRQMEVEAKRVGNGLEGRLEAKPSRDRSDA